MIKHRLFLPIIILLCSWAGCGFQMYLVHVNQVQRQEMKDAMLRLKDATQHLDNTRRQVEAETERLKGLLKMLPPQPIPNRTSKL